jgi:hypothetical protein
MQIPLLNGITTDAGADFRTSYPLNLIPVPKQNGVSNGYLRTADGMIEFANSIHSGSADRGAINWDGICYRVIGDWLTRVNADQTIDYLGELANDGKRCVMVNSFDRLAIAAAGNLYYYIPGTGVQQVTDPDLGTALDVLFIAGYYMTTDGEFLVVTDLNDPLAVNPLKYGSSEVKPDPVNSLLDIRNEVYAVNRYTIEVFQNIGGDGFPFQRVEGAMIPKGSIGTHASCYFGESFAFVGSGYNESLSVYIGGSGQSLKIATLEIETILSGYTETELAEIVVEARADKLQQLLYIHLPDQTLVYDASGSQAAGEPVWFTLTSGPSGDQAYRARNYVWCYGKWLFGDLQSLKIGYFTRQDARQFGETVPWQVDTVCLYNEGFGAIIHELELVRLNGREAISPLSATPTQAACVELSYTDDGLTWSQPRMSGLSLPGQPQKRTAWRDLGRMRQWRGFRLRGMNNPYPESLVRLEARLEQLLA